VAEQLALVLTEFDRRQDSQGRRLSSAETIAGVLVGAAAVTASVFASSQKDGWLIAALILILASGVLGVIALIPRRVSELVPARVRQSVLAANAADASLWLIDQKMVLIERRERLISVRYRLVRFGLVALIGAVACIIGSVVGIDVSITLKH
jgi:hypothetical protein